jgi:hypothetical protein
MTATIIKFRSKADREADAYGPPETGFIDLDDRLRQSWLEGYRAGEMLMTMRLRVECPYSSSSFFDRLMSCAWGMGRKIAIDDDPFPHLHTLLGLFDRLGFKLDDGAAS